MSTCNLTCKKTFIYVGAFAVVRCTAPKSHGSERATECRGSLLLRLFGPSRVAVPRAPTFTIGGLAVEFRRQLGVADIEVIRVGLGFRANHLDLIFGEGRGRCESHLRRTCGRPRCRLPTPPAIREDAQCQRTDHRKASRRDHQWASRLRPMTAHRSHPVHQGRAADAAARGTRGRSGPTPRHCRRPPSPSKGKPLPLHGGSASTEFIDELKVPGCDGGG